MLPVMGITTLISPTYTHPLAMLRYKTALYSQVKEELPKDGEQDALQTVRDDTCLEATAKEAQNAILQNDQPRSLGCTSSCQLCRTGTEPVDSLYETWVSLT